MKLQCEIGEGNNFFRKKLKPYNRLGRPYDEYWEMALRDYIEHQTGMSGQGLTHCKRIENNIWLLIREHIDIFPAEYLYILSLSCALHDCGKNKYLRKGEDHAAKGADTIQTSVVKRYVEKQITADAIAYIVRSHASGIFPSIEEPVDVGGDTPVMLRSCAAIFRLADMMDTSEERTPRSGNMDEQLNFVENVRRSISDCVLDTNDKSKIKIIPSSDDIRSLNELERYVEGLNNDLTSEHVELLKRIKIKYYKKNKLETKIISLPHKFYISEGGHSSTIVQRDVTASQPFAPAHLSTKRLTPCYFLNSETNLDIRNDLLRCIDKGAIDPKFLYWSLTGTKKYLDLCRNPFYSLPGVANNLLLKCFQSDFYPIISEHDHVRTIVDLGIGDGTEMSIMLRVFLSSEKSRGYKIQCALIDSSYHMLRVSVNNIDNMTLSVEDYQRDVLLAVINEDFRKLYLLRDKITGEEGGRLFCLLGGTLGNYNEKEIIGPISNELSNKDFFLLGVDLIGSRSDDDLKASYGSLYNKDFLFVPLSEIGYNFERALFECSISDKISDVSGSKTIISSFKLEDNKKICAAISTKYDLESLKTYLQDKFGFKILKDVTNETADYALLLLGKNKLYI